MLMGVNEYARHRGCQPQAVEYAIIAGHILRNPDGTIDREAADLAWEQNTEAAKARPGPKPAPLATEATPGMTYSSARALREVYEAQRRKLELEVRQGILISKAEVETEAFNAFRVLRDACFNVPHRLAAQLAAERDPATVHEMLEAELRRVFEDFAGGKLQ
jgi:hypothetical protein